MFAVCGILIWWQEQILKGANIYFCDHLKYEPPEKVKGV
jgi:hypothetical protein